MKRSFVIFLVTALVLTLASSVVFAKSQDFTKFSVLYLPTGYTPTEAADKNTVTFTSDSDKNIWFSIATEAKNGRTLDAIADAYIKELGGENKNSRQGIIDFTYKATGDINMILNIFDSNFIASMTETDVCLLKATEGVTEDVLREIQYSLVFDKTKIQKFTKLDIGNVPTDWTASEASGIVTLAKNDDKNCFITVEIAAKNNRRIQDIATALREEVNGNNISNVQGGVRFDYVQTGNVKVREFVFDNNYHTNLTDGYYCVIKYAFEKATLGNFYSVLYSTTFHPEAQQNTENNTGTDTGTKTQTDSNSVTSITSEEARSNVAKALSQDVANVNFIANTDLRAPAAAPTAVVNAVKGESFDITNNLSGINVAKTGHQAFQVTMPAALQGQSAENVRMYLTNKAVVGTASINASALPDGVTTAVLYASNGSTFTTVPATVIATANLNAIGEYGVYLAKKVSASNNNNNNNNDDDTLHSSSGGGCSAGFASMFALLGFALLKRR